MNAMNRALMTLLAASATGCLLWLASQFHTGTTGGYWAAMGVIAGGGLLLALAQLRGAGGNPPGMFLFAFVPVLIAGGWIVVAAEPHANTFRNHVRGWSGDLGITGAVHDISLWNGVVALGVGLVFGLTFEPWRRRAAATAPAVTPAAIDTRAADEPTTAERRERELAPETTTTKSPTRTVRS